MKFIEALKLRSRLLLLLAVITLGLVSIGVIGSLYVKNMKKSIDSVYFGSLIPVTELNDILHTYNMDLSKTIYKSQRLELSLSESASEIENALFRIQRKWQSYRSHYKRDDEKGYVDYTSVEIEKTNQYFRKILAYTLAGKDVSKISINTLEKKLFHITTVIEKLTHYEMSVAKYERRAFLKEYDKTLSSLGYALTIIILALLGSSYYVFSTIQEDHTRLENITKKLKKANKKLEHVSYVDPLTNLYNRRYFNHIYERELRQAKRDKSYITFMMLDIDFFKQYNDTYGHIAGDETLKVVAEVLQSTVKRPNDYVFRLGGEEFGVLLTKTDETNSARLAREICDTLRAKEIPHSGSKVNQFVTISIGVVCCVADEALENEILISRSDEMLYKTKDGGRDGYSITSNVMRSNDTKYEGMSA